MAERVGSRWVVKEPHWQTSRDGGEVVNTTNQFDRSIRCTHGISPSFSKISTSSGMSHGVTESYREGDRLRTFAGLAVAWLKNSHWWIVRFIANAYTDICRSVPVLVVMIWLFFSLPSLLTTFGSTSVRISPEFAAVAASPFIWPRS